MTENSDKSNALPFGALILDYEKACAELVEADRAEALARRDATAARNRVNELQKTIAERCAGMQKTAPRGTDWSNARHRVSE